MAELRSWVRLRLAAGREEDVETQLVLAGSLGWRTEQDAEGVVIEADFAVGAATGEDFERWVRSQSDLTLLGVARAEVQPDWIRLAASGLEPFAIGRRLWIDPSPEESSQPVPDGRIALRIPPRRAFGTGTHETTRMMLETLDEDPPVGQSVLDVGSGSGVLAAAAAELGATEIVAFDNDPDVLCARQLVQDRCRPGLFVGTLDGLRPERRFDRVLANITAPVLIREMESLAGRVAPRGRLVLTGILTIEAESVIEAALGQGLDVDQRRELGEWTALWACRR